MSTTKARADSLSLLLFTLRSGKLLAINLLWWERYRVIDLNAVSCSR